jgi:hypothetical protein
MAKKKKPKLTPEQRHRQLQDQVESLPIALDQLRAQGKWFRAFMVRAFAGPVLRIMKRMMDRQRYTGQAGQKVKQQEQMKRHLEQRRRAMEYMQGEMLKQQKKAQKRTKAR